MSSFFGYILLVIGLFATTVEARADENPQATSLRLHVQVAVPDLDPKAIEAAIARELDRSLEQAPAETAELIVDVDIRRKARLEFMTARDASIARSIELPNEPDRAIEMIALLAGNLVRDEAAELVRSLKPRSRVEASSDQSISDASSSMTTNAPTAVSPTPPKPPNERASKARSPETPAQRTRPALTPLLGSHPLNLSLFHPIALYRDSDRRMFHFELGLAYGRIGAVEGAALEFGVLDVRRQTSGFVLAGLAALTRGPTTGFVSSSLVTYGEGPLTGVELAGAASYREGDVSGLQLATAFALAADVTGSQVSAGLSVARDLEGAAVAAGASIASGRARGTLLAAGVTVAGAMTGFQGAAGINIAKEVDGVQAAGGVNVATTVSGVQAAGGVNVARDVDGLSIAPLNVSKNVRGLQLGVVNIAETVDGAALGVISIARNGRIMPQFFVTPNAPLNVGVRFVVGYAYSELGLGYEPSSKQGVPSIGAGAHFSVAPRLSLEAGFAYSTEGKLDSSFENSNDQLHYRIRAGFRAVETIELFAGGGVRHGLTQDGLSNFRPDFIFGIGFF